MLKKDLVGNEISDSLTLEINFKGEEFNSFVDINTLNKKLMAIDKTIKNTVKALKETRKIREKKEIIESIQIDLKRNSLDNTILINFIAPTISAIIGGLIVNYFTYLAKRTNLEQNSDEISILNKDISNLNHIEKLIEVKDIHSSVEIKFENNIFNITNVENLEIKKTIKKLKSQTDIEEYEVSFFGRIEKLDMSEGKEVFFFTIDMSDKKIPLSFENSITAEEVGSILCKRIKVNGIATDKNGILHSLHVLDYEDARKKTITDFTNKNK